MRGGTKVTVADLREEPSERGVRRFWALHLECGHTVRRPVRYRPGGQRGRRQRSRQDVEPAQDRAYCDQCPQAPRPPDEPTRIRIRAGSERAVQIVELLRTVAPDLVVHGPRWRSGGFVDYYCETRATPTQPSASPPAGSLVDLAVRAAARRRYVDRHGTDGPNADRYVDAMSTDPGYRAEMTAALTALAACGYLRQRPDQEGSAYVG